MKLSSAITRWQRMQDAMITQCSDVVTIHYPVDYSGSSSSYDSYFNESVDGNNPTTFSGVTPVTRQDVTVTGMMQGEVVEYDPVNYQFIGRFDPLAALFVCRISDATVDGKCAFGGSEYVTYDNERYMVDGWQHAGLGDKYIYMVKLRKTG